MVSWTALSVQNSAALALASVVKNLLVIALFLEQADAFSSSVSRLPTRRLIRVQASARRVSMLEQNEPRRLNMDNFDAWMKERKIKAELISHAVFSVNGGEQRGVVAEKDLAAGDTIAEVPRDSALCLLRGEKPPSDQVARFWDAHPQWYVRLGCKLLLERDKGAASTISGYIELLPDDYDQFPSEWTDDEISQLQCEKIESSIRRQKAKWKQIQDDFRSMCPQSAWSDADLRWAWHMCLSRAFAGNFGGGIISFVPIVGLLAEMSAIMSSASDADFALIPMIDSCNHKGALPSTALDFSPLARTLTLKASAGGVRAGEQVFITYGALGNDELLQRFGFVEEACEHDAYTVSKHELAHALQIEGGSDAVTDELIDRGLGSTCLDELVLRRRGKVEKELEVEMALGMLCGDDSKGVAGLERASKQALHRLCQALLTQMTSPGAHTSSLRPEVVMWREAKSAILRDCLLATARFV